MSNKVYFIIGQMCAGKTHYSKILGDMIGVEPFHLDNINKAIPLQDAYNIATQSKVIEGFTPFRNQAHLEAITKALEGKEVVYILIRPTYEKWLENCKPIIACPTDENPPPYSRDEYDAENKRLEKSNPRIIITN